MSQLIEANDITVAHMSVELETAVIHHRADDDGIYIDEDNWFPFWVSFRPRSGHLLLNTYVEFRQTATRDEQLELVNRINRSAFIGTAYVVERKPNPRMQIDHALYYRDGLIREAFIRMCRQFSQTVMDDIAKCDPDRKWTLRVGESDVLEQPDGGA